MKKQAGNSWRAMRISTEMPLSTHKCTEGRMLLNKNLLSSIWPITTRQTHEKSRSSSLSRMGSNNSQVVSLLPREVISNARTLTSCHLDVLVHSQLWNYNLSFKHPVNIRRSNIKCKWTPVEQGWWWAWDNSNSMGVEITRTNSCSLITSQENSRCWILLPTSLLLKCQWWIRSQVKRWCLHSRINSKPTSRWIIWAEAETSQAWTSWEVSHSNNNWAPPSASKEQLPSRRNRKQQSTLKRNGWGGSD